MTRKRKLLLAYLVAGQVIAPIVWITFYYFVRFVFHGEHFPTTLMKIVFYGTSAIGLLLWVICSKYYGFHVASNVKFNGNTGKRVFWDFFIYTGPIGQSIYWYKYIWQN